MNTVDAILADAADTLRVSGWTQGYLQANGSPCLVGAIYMVAPALDYVMAQAFRTVATRLGLEGDTLPLDEVVDWIAIWNDEPGRTLVEVLALLEPDNFEAQTHTSAHAQWNSSTQYTKSPNVLECIPKPSDVPVGVAG